jgi:cellulose biosynthesis protein BcsQ
MEIKQEKTIKNLIEDTDVYSRYIKVLNNEIIEKLEEIETYLTRREIEDVVLNKSINTIHSLSFMIEEFQILISKNFDIIIQDC